MVFCAYCGKSFTRKEHLERHLPSHTNVKPHRCRSCQLSFARRDLLQRHHSSYHEDNDPIQSLPGGAPTIAGQTLIACFNCARSKTSCDKRVPCSRCADKNIPCTARFARPSSKAAVRSRSCFDKMAPQCRNNDFMDVDRVISEDTFAESRTISPNNIVDDAQRKGWPQKKTGYTPQALHFVDGTFDAYPTAGLGGIDDFMLPNGGPFSQEINYRDLLAWNEPRLDLGMYSDTGIEMQTNMGMSTCSEPSEISSISGAITSGSISTSLSVSDARAMSISSQEDFEHSIETEEVTTPTANITTIPEFEVIIAAEAAWPLALCNTRVFSGACPRTAFVHLESLEKNLKHEGTWKLLDHKVASTELNQKRKILVVPLSTSTRDRILVITQSFLHKALETHRGGSKGWPQFAYPIGCGEFSFHFPVLPPSNALDYLLQSCVRSLVSYFTLVNGGAVDPNELTVNNQVSTLVVLLMIAQGATALPTSGARCLTAGLSEACRISLVDIIEKDIELSADPAVLRCAFLFMILGAWSGDAWHMNIATSQRGMYLAMLKHAGMLEPQSPMTPSFNDSSSTEYQWKSWLQRESRNRLVYNWVIVDQEMSLFYDTAPILLITELKTPIPDSECLWLAKDATEWFAAVQQTYMGTDRLCPNSPENILHTPSLHVLFQDMLHDNIDKRYQQLSPLQLKLLLHPLQSLLCHLHQGLSCIPDFLSSQRGTKIVFKASTLLRLQEIQSLLQKWYSLYTIHAKADPTCPITQATLVLYHLISLNAVTSFPEIERLARKEGLDGHPWEFSLPHQRCFYQLEEALIHCGQVIRLIRLMSREDRPNWWPVAIYRVTMILWVHSMSQIDPKAHKMEKGQIFAIDAVTLEHPSVESYLSGGEGIPVLTKAGSYTKLHRPDAVLNHCITLLDLGIPLRISEGIKRKLQTLSKNWNMEL